MTVEIVNRDLITRPFKRPASSKIRFPYLTISEMAKAIKDFIHFDVYQDFKGFVYGGYDKGLQTYRQQVETVNQGDLIDYGLPLISYTINIDGPAETVDSTWRSSKLNIGHARVIYEPFYKDDDLELRIVYRRFKGTIDLNIFCSSQPEQLDIQMSFIDSFISLNKFIVAPLRVFTIIPDSFLATDIHGVQINRVFKKENISRDFIEAVNERAYYLGCNTNSQIRLVSLTPSNKLYGGKDLPEFTLTGSMEFEVDIPQYILAWSSCVFQLNLDISVAFSYESNNRNILNNYFGRIRSNQPDNTSIDCENGCVRGWKGVVIKSDDISEICFDEVYPEPRQYQPGQKDIEIILDSPLGVMTEDSGLFTITKKEDGLYYIKLVDGVTFQKDDLVAIYIFEPLKEINFE